MLYLKVSRKEAYKAHIATLSVGSSACRQCSGGGVSPLASSLGQKWSLALAHQFHTSCHDQSTDALTVDIIADCLITQACCIVAAFSAADTEITAEKA